MSLARRISAALLTLALLPGCAPSAAPTSTPTPTYWCTPLPTPGVSPGPPYRCPEYRARMNAQTHASEAEAMEVYRRFFDEFWRLQVEGGALEPTPIILETTEGAFQRANMAVLRDQKENAFRVQGPPPILTMAPDRNRRYADSEVVLTTCEDARTSALMNPDGTKNSDGRLYVRQAFFRRTEGRLKVFVNDRLEGVTQCPFD